MPSYKQGLYFDRCWKATTTGRRIARAGSVGSVVAAQETRCEQPSHNELGPVLGAQGTQQTL